MNESNKLVIAVVALGAMLLVMGFGLPLLVDKTTKNVIQELRSGRYSPGPYAPGFDPDMVNPTFFKDVKKVSPPSQPNPDSSWQMSWENERISGR